MLKIFSLVALVMLSVWPAVAIANPEKFVCRAYLDKHPEQPFTLTLAIDYEKKAVIDGDGPHSATILENNIEWGFISKGTGSEVVFRLDIKTGTLKLNSTNPKDNSGNYQVSGHCGRDGKEKIPL